MIHSQFSANSVQHAPDTALPATLPPPALSDRHERFCQELLSNGGNLADAYRAVYPAAGSQVAVWNNACRLRARADVRARMRELQSIAAEGVVITAQQQLVELAEQAAVDVTELQPIIHTPCPACAPLYAAELAEATQLYLAGEGPMPDCAPPTLPHPDCADVRAHTRVEIRPMSEWSPAARRLYNGVEFAKDGTPRLVLRDRNQIQDQVNRLLGGYVSRSENITAHVQVDPSKPNPWSGASLTPEQVLERVRRSRGVVAVIEQQPPPPEPQP
jgi:hypothetical protein